METMSAAEEQNQNIESKLIKYNTREYFFQTYLFVSHSNDNFEYFAKNNICNTQWVFKKNKNNCG